MLTALEKALRAASILLVDDDEAEFRLRDFLVEEVSLVDRAANKRRFLVVKNAVPKLGRVRVRRVDDEHGVFNGAVLVATCKTKAEADAKAIALRAAGGDSDPSDPSDPKNPTPATPLDKRLTLPSDAKEGMLRSLTEALERVVAISNAVRDAEETSEPSDTPTPDVLGTEIRDISEMLAGILTRFPATAAKREETTMLEKLQTLQAEIAKLVEAGGDIDEAKLAELQTQVAALTAKAKPAGDPPAGDPSLAKSLADLATVINGIAEQAKTAEGDKPTDEIKASVKRVHETLSAIVDKDLGGGIPFPSNLGTEVSDKLKTLAAVMAQIAEAPDPFTLMDMSEKMLGIGKSLGEVAKSVADAKPAPAPAAAAPAPAEVDKHAKKATTRRLESLGKLIEGLAELYRELGGSSELATKRATENTPQGPPGSSVGVMPDGDGKAADKTTEEGLAVLMKRLDAIDTKVEQMQRTPEPPASRSEPHVEPPPGGDNGQRRKRRGGPWIW